MRFLLPILLILSLASCGTSTDGVGDGGGYGPKHYQCIEEGHEAGSDDYINCLSDVAYSLSIDGQRCKNYGFNEGTDSFAECQMKMAQQRKQEQLNEQQRQAAIWRGLQQAGQALQTPSQQSPTQQRTQTECRELIGNRISCTTW